MTIHSALKGEAYCQANPSELEGVLMTVAGIDELKQEATEAVEAKYRPIIERGNQQLTELRYQLEQANQRLTAPDQEKTTLVARVAELETALEKAGAKTQSAVLQTEARLGEELSAVKARLEESEARSKRALENLVFPESAVSEILGAVFGRGGRRIKTDQALIEIKEAWLRAVSSVAQEEQAR
jgi:small-conductance mechanosensitive channel